MWFSVGGDGGQGSPGCSGKLSNKLPMLHLLTRFDLLSKKVNSSAVTKTFRVLFAVNKKTFFSLKNGVKLTWGFE